MRRRGSKVKVILEVVRSCSCVLISVISNLDIAIDMQSGDQGSNRAQPPG